MNERQGKNGGANVAIHDVLYQQITSHSDEAINVALGLVDEADKAAQKMVAECETLLAAVRQGTEQIRSELREKMVEFATVMRDYSEEIAAKNRAYVEAARNTTERISSHIEAVRAAMNSVAHKDAPTAVRGSRPHRNEQGAQAMNNRPGPVPLQGSKPDRRRFQPDPISIPPW